MRSRCKKLITDINRKANLNADITEYKELLGSQYNYYAIVKMCMNYYTMKEVIAEQEDKNTDVCRYFSLVTDFIRKHIIDRAAVTEETIGGIRQVRSNVEYKMKNLTAYADGFEIYEYILNRIEAGIKDDTEDVDIEQLSAKMFQYVFAENDTLVINSKLQLLMSQLPVRMTKNKFFDVVSNTLSIYKGGEVSSVCDFADMLRTAVLIKKPKGFETEYPYLYHVYTDLRTADYKNMDLESYESLSDRLRQAADIINNEVSAYMLFQEIVNDVYTILLTIESCYDNNMTIQGYKAAVDILGDCIAYDDMEELPERIMSEFITLEGVQETVYENIMILEAAFDDIRTGYSELIESMGIACDFEKLDIIAKLLSTSLFIDLDKARDAYGSLADNDFIMKLRDELTSEFAQLFAENNRIVNRSIMCKILSSMPIFLNSQQEIKAYFDYVLGSCKDKSELTACSRLINELIDEDV